MAEDAYGEPTAPCVAKGQLTDNAVAKFAVSEAGPVIVTVVAAAVALATGPVQPLKAKPEFGVAVTFCTEPAGKNEPEAGVTVPPFEGDAAVVS